MNSTNMACLTPEGAMSGDCDFLSANLYARSLFGSSPVHHVNYWGNDLLMMLSCISGEDALANLSIEKTESGSIAGHVRIRSKTQGIALSLGDRITLGKSFAMATAHPLLITDEY
jgi:coatomer subunit beta